MLLHVSVILFTWGVLPYPPIPRPDPPLRRNMGQTESDIIPTKRNMKQTGNHIIPPGTPKVDSTHPAGMFSCVNQNMNVSTPSSLCLIYVLF